MASWIHFNSCIIGGAPTSGTRNNFADEWGPFEHCYPLTIIDDQEGFVRVENPICKHFLHRSCNKYEEESFLQSMMYFRLFGFVDRLLQGVTLKKKIFYENKRERI